MRVLGVAIFACVMAAAAQAADFPEAHLLLVDRHALRLADTHDDDTHFEAAAKPIYRALLLRHGANLILDARAAPAHWSGLDVTAEAIAAVKAPAAQKNDTAAAPASSVRLLVAEIPPAESSDTKFHETLEQIAAGQGATLVVDRRAVVMSAPRSTSRRWCDRRLRPTATRERCR